MEQEYGVFYGSKLYADSPKKEAIIEHFLYKADTMCISAEPGIGKSIFMLQLIFSLTTQQALLDTYDIKKKCNVLYVQTEGDRGETLDRIACMKKGLTLDDTKWVHINLPGLEINTKEGIMSLITKAQEPKINYDVVMLDPMYTTVKGDMNKNEVATDWVRNIRMFKSIFNCAMVINYHENKEVHYKGQVVQKSKGNIFGSVYWGAFFNTIFKLKIYNGIHYLECGKQRSGNIANSIEMKLIEPSPLLFVNDDEHLELSTIKVSKFLKEAKDRLTVKQLVRLGGGGVGMSQPSIYRSIKKLYKNKLVDNIIEDRESYYTWKK